MKWGGVLLLAAVLAGVLAGVFGAYLSPDFVIDTANLVAGCG